MAKEIVVGISGGFEGICIFSSPQENSGGFGVVYMHIPWYTLSHLPHGKAGQRRQELIFACNLGESAGEELKMRKNVEDTRTCVITYSNTKRQQAKNVVNK